MTRFDDAEATYSTWLLFNDGTVAADFVGVRDLVRYVAEPGFELTPAQSAALDANPRVRASYLDLLQRFSVAMVPIVAAASDGDVEERILPGARVTLSPSVRVPEYYLRLELEPWLVAMQPLHLHLIGKAGIIKRSVPLAADFDEVTLILNPARDSADGLLLALLRDPTSEGGVVPSRTTTPAGR